MPTSPHLVMDIHQKKKILDVLESATRGLRRMEAVLDRVPEQQVRAGNTELLRAMRRRNFSQSVTVTNLEDISIGAIEGNQKR